jgi:hypothetical protein
MFVKTIIGKSEMLIKNMSLYTLAHLLVDMVCMWVMFYIFLQNPYDGIKYALVYNFFAFGFQPLAGIIADKLKNPSNIVAASFLLLIAGVLVFPLNNMAAAVIIGIANTFFHVGGGIVIYNLNPETSKWQGVYISSGGIGLALGAFLAQGGYVQGYMLCVVLAVLALVAFFTKTPEAKYKKQTAGVQKNTTFFIVFIVVVAAIAMRSLSGLEFSKLISGGTEKWILVLAVAVGKFIGGFSFERFGIVKSILIPLAAVLLLLGVQKESFIFIVLVSFFIQMSTAATLFILFTLMPKRPGFAFGINCLAIFTGFLLFLLFGVNFFSGFCAIAVFLLLIFFIHIKYRDSQKRLF